ncbi:MULTISPECIES: DUF1353 domain-containing protein [unclassified Bradyrhizobium]|uniref:DUF1353 domain-containing protein n=1 Tax=unclassified Bradyrhizobium TaxID=2631580 RepID=UPI0029167A50|nr:MULTISPECIES: DUF1353 domain-containing protein [unclassified Bradyrhizobium]
MVTRRDVLKALAIASTPPLLLARDASAARKKAQISSQVEAWMNRWMTGEKKLGGAMRVSRFRDPIYFLIAPISWTPNLNDAGKYQAVEVPTGFVTDFASIPPIFFSVLRADGEYAYAAVIHDYLYWTQMRTREEADEIIKLAMRDLKVDSVKLTAIYEAVRHFGGKAWNDNARLKSQGEKRILIKFPDDPTINWEEWKKQPGVFAT